MLYYVFTYLNEKFDFPGAGAFEFISFRAAGALLVSLIISWAMGGKLIAYLRRKQVGETVRDLGLTGQKEKEGTPTMGGIIILAAIFIPTILFAKLNNIYILLMLLTTVWMGVIGFVDDYIKVFKKDKRGLAGRFKIFGQVGLGLIIGAVFIFSDEIVVREEVTDGNIEQYNGYLVKTETVTDEQGDQHVMAEYRAPVTTIPFVKNNEFNYAKLISWMGNNHEKWMWLIFIPIVIFIVSAVSNGANMTDGLDGLATGSSAIIGFALAIFAYVSGNVIFSEYLDIMYIPNSGELVIFAAAFMGACVGFLWYNAYPAQVFMGDTGSLAIGGIIATFAILIRKELLIPILCGVFLAENISVMMQVAYFKYTKKRFGEGKRILLMAPLHHHYQKLGWHESKIVSRFWIIGIMLAVLSIVTLKIR